MIEIDGVTYPLEPGKQYLFLYNRAVMPAHLVDRLAHVAREKLNVTLLMVGVHGPADQSSVRIVGPVAPEAVTS